MTDLITNTPPGDKPPDKPPEKPPDKAITIEDPSDTFDRKTFILKSKDRLRYNKNSLGPFMVSLSKEGIGSKHTILVGETLYKAKIKGIKAIKKINNNLINVEFISKEHANDLIDNFSKYAPYKDCKAFIPLNNISRRLIVDDVHNDLGIKTIAEYLEEKYSSIISVRRIFRKNELNTLVPTSKLDLLWEGTILPDFLYVFYSKCKVAPYIYNVVKCNHCLNYGHRAEFRGTLNCKSTPRCPNCSEVHVAHDICYKPIKCFH